MGLLFTRHTHTLFFFSFPCTLRRPFITKLHFFSLLCVSTYPLSHSEVKHRRTLLMKLSAYSTFILARYFFSFSLAEKVSHPLGFCVQLTVCFTQFRKVVNKLNPVINSCSEKGWTPVFVTVEDFKLHLGPVQTWR